MSTVLIVDDEPQIRTSLRGILSEEGLRVLEAADGRRALEIIQREAPEVVLLDIWMPDVDGMELLEALHGTMPPPHVIMISGHGNIETAVRATKLGAFDFIEKPFSLDALLSVVNRALEHHARTARCADATSDEAPDGVRRDVATASLPAPQPSHRWSERTIARSVVVSGHGLHTGIKTGLILQPAPSASGIQFASLSSEVTVPAHLDWVDSTGYATALHRQGTTVRTIEHLLASLHAYRITNLLVKTQGEIPILDGSAGEFCSLIESAGVAEQDGTVEEIVIDEPIEISKGGGESIRIEPAEGFSISYTLRYPPPVGEQCYLYNHRGPESFCEEIAPARTFGFVRDVKQLSSMGLASGGRLDNLILIDDEKVVNTNLRYPEELARHKILDIMGDSYLLGRPIRGRITACMTGHSDNIALLQAIRKHIGALETAVEH
jgi:UDP-3-O-acyl N-acetylglucosamine deacetylase